MSSGGPERIVEPEEILQGGAQICPGGLAGYLPGHGTTVGGHDSGDALLIGVLRAGGHVAHHGHHWDPCLPGPVGDADDHLAPKALTVDTALAGQDRGGTRQQGIEAHCVQDCLDPHLQATAQEGHHTGSHAAGGMGAGVMAFLGSRLQMGIETVLDTVGFDALLPGATAVLTGEGRIDCQSLRGKVVIGIAHRARQARIPVVAVVGDVAPGAEDAYQEGVTAIVSTNRRAVPWEVARQSARADLCAALEDLFRLYNAFRSAR